MLTQLSLLETWTNVARHAERFCVGALCAALCIIWLHVCGLSGAALTGLLLAVLCTSGLSCWLSADRTVASWICLAFQCACLIAIPTGLPGLAAILSESLTFSARTLSHTTWIPANSTYLIPGMLVAIPGSMLLSMTRLVSPPATEVNWTSRWSLGAGLTTPLLLSSAQFPLILSPQIICGSTAIATLAIRQLKRHSAVSTAQQKPKLESQQYDSRGRVSAALLLVFAGIVLIALTRLMQAFVSADPIILIAGVGIATAVSMLLMRFFHSNTFLISILMLLLFGPVMLAACYPDLTDLSILAAAERTGSSILLFRTLLAAGMFLPGALAVCLVLSRSCLPEGFTTAAVATGMLIGLKLQGYGITATYLLLFLQLFSCCLFITSHQFSRFSSRRRLGVLTMLPAAILLFLQSPPDFNIQSRLLKSPRSVAALQRGYRANLIPATDDARIMQTDTESGDDVAVWNRLGYIREFRTNGASPAYLSTDTAICPQPAQEILPVIFALCNHPLTNSLLLIGDDSSAGLRTAVSFPLRRILTIRHSSSATALAKSQYSAAGQKSPFADDRVVTRCGPVGVELRCLTPQKFDSLVINEGPDSLGRMSQAFSAESCRLYREILTPGGILAARFHSNAAGSETIRRLLSTLRSSFDRAGVVQVLPDEMLLLATDNSRELISPQFFSNLQKPHAKSALFSSGWDWASVSVLAMLDSNDPIGIFSDSLLPPPISAVNPWLLTRHTVERLSGRDLKSELRQDLAPHQMQIASAIDVNDDHHEAKRRLASIAQEKEILAGLPDQPWTYRKSLRMEMQRSPRRAVERYVNGQIQRTPHPLDQIRRDYFEQLGAALKSVRSGAPDAAAQIRKLERFASCGEPLLSHFANYEIVRLHELAGHPSPADEWKHRLRIVLTAENTDASVRATIAALEQLVDRPELVDSKTARYDHLNGLLQKLIERWEARTRWDPISAEQVQTDIDESVRVCQQTLDQMDEIGADLQVESEHLKQRRQYISEALIVPLRNYRKQVVSHRIRNTQQNRLQKDELPALLDPSDMINSN